MHSFSVWGGWGEGRENGGYNYEAVKMTLIICRGWGGRQERVGGGGEQGRGGGGGGEESELHFGH